MSKADELIGVSVPVLDQGWVALAGVMGTDQTIVDRARGTTGTESVDRSKDETLIRHMMRHHHGSSFEFCEIDIQFCCPFYVWRQVVRHRAGNMTDEASMWDEPAANELSGRYAEVPEEIQEIAPSEWRLQSKSNRQGSDGFFPESQGCGITNLDRELADHVRHVYGYMLFAGVAKEQARKVWPMGGYTVGFIKMDLRNWLSFLALRLAPDSQFETRQYAAAIADNFVSRLFPVTWRAFSDYVLNAMTLSSLDIEAFKAVRWAGGSAPPTPADDALRSVFENKRERDECRAKLVRLGIIWEE